MIILLLWVLAWENLLLSSAPEVGRWLPKDRTHGGNIASRRVAEKAGFGDCGWTITPDGDRLRLFQRELYRPTIRRRQPLRDDRDVPLVNKRATGRSVFVRCARIQIQ